MSKQSLHLRVDDHVIRGVDAVAMGWNVSRNEAANRLLDEGIRRHIDDVRTAFEQMLTMYAGHASNETG